MDNKNKTELYGKPLALAVVCLVSYGSASAAELSAEFRGGYTVSDNIFLESEDGIEDNIWSVGMTLNLFEESSRTLIDVRAVADYLHYFDTFDPETVGALDALFDYAFIENYFSWRIQNNYGQRLADPLGTPNPGNRENMNFFTTGPNVDIPMGERFFLGLEARLSTVRYEVSVNENDRTSGLIRLARRTDGNAVMSLNVATEDIEYADGATAEDFRVNDAYVAYDANNDRNIILVNLGYTEVETDSDSASGYLVRAQWTRFTTESKSFLISAGSEYSTQGDVFRLSQSNGRSIGGTVDTNTDDIPFRNNHFYSRYSANGDRTRISVEVEWSQEDFTYQDPLAVALDRDILRGSFDIERDITRKFYVGLDLRFRTRDYKFVDRDDEDVRAIATLGFRFSDAFIMFLRYQYQDRDSNDVTESFTENRGTIGFEYIPAWGR